MDIDVIKKNAEKTVESIYSLITNLKLNQDEENLALITMAELIKNHIKTEKITEDLRKKLDSLSQKKKDIETAKQTLRETEKELHVKDEELRGKELQFQQLQKMLQGKKGEIEEKERQQQVLMEQEQSIKILYESVDALLRMEEEHKEILAHLKENEHIMKGFRDAGFIKEGDAAAKADELSSKSEEILKKYDLFLGGLLETAKKERDEIAQRQKIAKE